MEMSRPRETGSSGQPKNVEQIFTDLKGTMGHSHRLDAIDELEVAKKLLHYADVGVRARSIREKHGDISLLPLDQQIDHHDLREVAPILKGMVISESERGKLEAARQKIRSRFSSDMTKLGLTPSNWSRESDSWIYQGVGERRFYYRDSKKAPEQKAPAAEADPLEDGPGSARELELVGDARLGWEARAQSWRLEDRGHELKYEFASRPVLDKLNKSDSSYPEIEKLLKRPYKVFEIASTDIKRNPLQLIKQNFSKAELQKLGELIRKNLDFDDERAKADADKKDKKKEELPEKKNPWEGAKHYQAGDQIIYRRPTGEWSTGELVDDPEELSRNRKKFKVKNTETDPVTGVSDGKIEEYTTDTPPRMYESIPDEGLIRVSGKEYTRANRHMGDNRVEFDLEEVGGDGKILNVDSDAVRTAMEAHRLAEAIDKQVGNLRGRIEQGVASRSRDVGGKLAELSKHAKEIEKIFGTASKINKLLPERVEEVRTRIAEIQREFSASVGQLSKEITGIQEKSQEVRDKAGKKLEADRVEKAIADRLQQLDTLTIAREGGMGRLDEWKDKKKKYDDWVKGEKKGPPVIDPGEPPFRLPSEIQKDRNKVYVEVLEGLQPDSLFAKELDKRVREQFGDNLSGLLSDTGLSKDIDQKQKELDKQEQERRALLRGKSRIDRKGSVDVQGALDQISEGETEESRINAELVQFNKDRVRLDAELQQLRLNKEVFSQPAPDVSEIERRLNGILTQLQEKNNQLQELNNQGQAARPQNQRGRQAQGRQGLDALAGLVTVAGVTDAIRGLEKNKDIIEEELVWARLRANPDQLLASIDNETDTKEKELKALIKTITEQETELRKNQKKVAQGRKLLGIGNAPTAATLKTWKDTLDALTAKNTEIGVTKAAFDQLRRQSDNLLQKREQEVRTIVAQKIIEDWKAIKVEVPPVSIPDQQQEVRTKADELDKKITALPVSDRVKRDLRGRLTALADKIENLPRDQYAAEQALAELWANEIRTLEVDVYAQDLHAKPEAKGHYEKLEGRVELPNVLIAELLRGREQALRPVLDAIFDTTLEAEPYTTSDTKETFNRVKLDKKSAEHLAGIFDGATPPDSVILSRLGIRDWDEFKRVWKDEYAPQVTMYLQESVRVALDIQLQRDDVFPPQEEPKVSIWGQARQTFGKLKFWGKKEGVKMTQEGYDHLRSEACQALRDKMKDQLGIWIGGAMAAINAEMRIHGATSQAERAGILALTGLPEIDRNRLRRQGTYLTGPNEQGDLFRLKRTAIKEDLDVLVDLDEEEYEKARGEVQKTIDSVRGRLEWLYKNSRPDFRMERDVREIAFQDSIKILEEGKETLTKIIFRSESMDEGVVAIGNSDPIMRDQIAAVLSEASRYIPAEAAILSETEREALGVKMRKVVAAVEKGTHAAAAHDTTGVAHDVHASMTGDHGHGGGHDGHGGGHDDGHGGDQEGGDKKKGKSKIAKWEKWLIAGMAGAATLAVGLTIPVVQRINKPAPQQERKASSQKSEYQYGNLDAYRNAYNVDYKMVRADENTLEVRQANFENNIGPSNPIVGIIEFDTQEKISSRDPEAAKGIVEAVKSIVKDPNWSATDQAKVKAERKLVSSVGEGYRNFGFMLNQSKYESQTKPVLEAAKQKNNKEVVRLLQELSKEKVEPNIDPSTVDKETGLPAYVKFKVERDAKGRVKSEETTKNLVNEMNKLKEGAENYYKAHPVTPDQMNAWIDEALNLYVLDESAKTKQEMKALTLGVLYSESTFHPSKVSVVNGGGYGIGQTAGSVLQDYPFGAADLRPNAFIAKNGVKLAVYELAKRLNKYPDMKFTMLAYVWGQNRDSLEKGDVSRLNIDTTKTKYSDLSKEQQDYVDIRRYANRNLAYRDFYRSHSFPETPPKPPTEIIDQFIEVKGKPAEKPGENKPQNPPKPNTPPLVASR